MKGNDLLSSVVTVMAVVLMVVFAALIIGTILSQTVFSSLTIINTTAISASFGSFVTNLIAFLAIIGTIIGVVWLVMYVKQLFDKKQGLTGISA